MTRAAIERTSAAVVSAAGWQIRKATVMTLSEHELRTLAEIESGCCAEDPGFAARLDLPAARNRRARAVRIARCAVWLGSLMFVAGAGAARGVVSGGVVISLYGVAILVAGIVGWVHNRARGTGHRT